MSLSDTLALAALALIVEAAVGYPGPVWRAIGHPVAWIGRLIGRLDDRLNRPTMPERRRRLNGVAALLAVLAAAALPAWAAQAALFALLPWLAALLVLAVLAASLPAQRSLDRHVAAVAAGLERDGLAGGRAAVRHIVGRNPESLDEAGVARAAIESLAENLSDGVTAPAFWCAAAGLPGMAAYKAANTADSMIGHRTERHRAFGWAAARFDDLVNLPASRTAALALVAGAALTPGCDAGAAWRAVRRDAGRHRSPNAGWPEAAMAGALGLRLAGPRTYGTEIVPDHWMGDGRADATAADIRRALRLYRTACALQIGLLAVLAAITAPGR